MSVNSLKRCQMFWVHLETIKNIPFRFNFQLALKWKEPIRQQQMFVVHILIFTCWQWAGSDWWKWWLNTKLGSPNSRWDFSDLNKTDICKFLLVYTSHWHSSSSSLPGLPCTPNSVRFKISLQRVVKGPNIDKKWKDIFVIVPSSESLYWTDYCYFYISPGGQLSPWSIRHQEDQH